MCLVAILMQLLPTLLSTGDVVPLGARVARLDLSQSITKHTEAVLADDQGPCNRNVYIIAPADDQRYTP